MKKSELRQIIREEIQKLHEAGPSQQQIKQNKKNQEIFKKADKAYKDLVKFFQKWDRELKDDDPTKKQYIAAEKALQNAMKDLQPFFDSDSEAIITHGTAAQKLHKQAKSMVDGIKYMLYGD